MNLDERTTRSLIRLRNLMAVAVIPVLIASLQANTFDWRATASAVAVAVLGALLKYVTWTEEPTRTDEHATGS